MAWFPCNIGGSIEPEEEKTLLFTHNNLASWTTYEVSNDVDDILIESTYTLHEKEVTERTFLKLSGVGVWPYYDHIAISSTQVLDIGFKDNTIHFRSQNNIAASYNAVTNIYSYKKGSKSKYIKATGSFISGTETWQKVEVNCGFKPDLVMVDMAFGNGFTRATYLSTAWYESTDHPTSVWDLRPIENVIYAITPGSEQGETGISDLTDTGFKYRVNGGNTQGKACTYTAIKFDVEEVPEPDTSVLLFKDGEFYNTDKVELGIENGVVSDGAILFTTSNTVGGIYFNSSTMDDRFVMAVHYENDNQSVQVRMQYGTSKVGTSVINVINSGTDRYAYASKSVNKGVNDLITVLKETDGDDTIGAFFGNQSANATWKIYEIYLIPY